MPKNNKLQTSEIEEKLLKLENENKTLQNKLIEIENILKNNESLPKEIFDKTAQYLVPKIRNNNYEMLLSDYKYNGISDRLLASLQALASSKFCWLSENNKLWLLYMHILIENDIPKQVSTLAKRYTYFHKLKDIEYFPLVANYFHSHNLTNEKIEKSAFVCQKILESEKNQVFENLVKGKSIAVVGNGPYELGKKKGKEIDNHDVVIRFSNGTRKGYEEDYGAKTSVWVNTASNLGFADYEKVDFTLSLWRFDTFYFREDSGLENIYSVSDRKCQKFGKESAKYAWNELGLSYILTTGCDLIVYLYTILSSLEKVDFYGFHFLDTYNQSEQHYFYQGDILEVGNFHNLDEEPRFMQKFILEHGGKLDGK